MDDAVSAWVQRQLGAPLHSRSPVGGGCIHGAWALTLADGRRCFLKCNRAAALPLLAAEADGLLALAAVAPAALQLPEPLAWGQVADQAVLLLEWLNLDGRPRELAWRQLGQSLARLHRNSLARGSGCGRFGWERDNFIGATPQPNGWHERWGPFFVEQRLGHQLRLAQAAGCPFAGAERLLLHAQRLLADHAPDAVLVHGDLWSGNAAVLTEGRGALYDPAVYRGDREVDLAMARLFGGFPPAFFSGYNETWPLPPESAQRQPLYNLYHLLNHALLFGAGYHSQAQQCINDLLA